MEANLKFEATREVMMGTGPAIGASPWKGSLDMNFAADYSAFRESEGSNILA